MRRENDSEISSHSFGCCQGFLLAPCSVQFYSVEVRGGISMLKSDSLWRSGTCVRCIFFLCELQRSIGSNQIEILQVRVLKLPREPVYWVSSSVSGMSNSHENYPNSLKERDFKINFDLTVGGFSANSLGHAIQKLGCYSCGSKGTHFSGSF